MPQYNSQRLAGHRLQLGPERGRQGAGGRLLFAAYGVLLRVVTLRLDVEEEESLYVLVRVWVGEKRVELFGGHCGLAHQYPEVVGARDVIDSHGVGSLRCRLRPLQASWARRSYRQQRGETGPPSDGPTALEVRRSVSIS